MVMRDIGSFHCPETRFISRGAAEGNKHWRGNHTLTVLLYRYNTFMPVYLQLLSFYDHVNRKSDPTVSRLCHGSSPILKNFSRYLVKTLSIMVRSITMFHYICIFCFETTGPGFKARLVRYFLPRLRLATTMTASYS